MPRRRRTHVHEANDKGDGNHTLGHSTVARTASAVLFFRFFPLLSVASDAVSRSRCRFFALDLGAVGRGGASTPAGFMKPADLVFAALVFAALAAAIEGGAEESEMGGAACVSRISCSAVFVRVFLPSFDLVDKGALNPEMDVRRPLPLSAFENAAAPSSNFCSSESGSCVCGQRSGRRRQTG